MQRKVVKVFSLAWLFFAMVKAMLGGFMYIRNVTDKHNYIFHLDLYYFCVLV